MRIHNNEIQRALDAMQNLGVALNEHDSAALETLCDFAAVALLAQGAAPSQDGEQAKRIAQLEKALSDVRKAAGSAQYLTNRLQFIYERAGLAIAGEEWDNDWKAIKGYKKRDDVLAENERLRIQISTARADGFEQCKEMAAAISKASGHYRDADSIRALQCPEQPAAPSEDKPVKTFPDRDKSKTAEQQGIFRKFDVRRVDGSDQPGGKHYGCRYFVIDLDHDQYAPDAMRTYAAKCKETHPQLAADIYAEFGDPAAQSDSKDADQVHELFLHEDCPLDGIDGGKPFCKFILYRDGGGTSAGEPSREYFALSKDQSDTELEDLLRRTSARKIKDFEVRHLMERHGLHHKFLSDLEVNRFFSFVRDLLKIEDTPIAALAQQAGKERGNG